MLKHSVLLFFFSIFSLPLQSADFNLLEFDLLSVKLLTFDNLFLRLPDKSLIKPEAVTLTRFPVRGINILAGDAAKEDQKKSIHEEIKNAFDNKGTETPFPYRILHTGSETGLFQARQVKTDPSNRLFS